MEGVAEKTIRDVASMSTDHKIPQIPTQPFFPKESSIFDKTCSKLAGQFQLLEGLQVLERSL